VSERHPWQQPLGARPQPGDRTTFRVWAPHPESVEVRVRGEDHAMRDIGFGIHEATVEAGHGDDYWFVLDGAPLPDPATRWQPEGLRGPSRVVDTNGFDWTDDAFRIPPLSEVVLYELHIGTFSDDGTLDAAIPHLDALAELGINAVELMPVAEFPGTRGWGYDGVYISATQSSYGGPEALQRFVDAAHARGIAVLLDVVYNHVGASGNQALAAYGPYFTD
jgi:maltooligosyltrehalose trehalohydrolase